MKGQLLSGAIFNPNPPQVQCSGWCYSEAEADTGEWKHSLGNLLLCDQSLKIYRFWFSLPIVYNYAWTIEKFSRICASYKPGKTMYSDQFVVMVNGRETRLQPSWIVICICNLFLKVAVEDVPKRQKAPGHGLRHTFPQRLRQVCDLSFRPQYPLWDIVELGSVLPMCELTWSSVWWT